MMPEQTGFNHTLQPTASLRYGIRWLSWLVCSDELRLAPGPVGGRAAFQQWIRAGEQSGLLTRIATTESASLCVRMKS
jgi:hypothetical protein